MSIHSPCPHGDACLLAPHHVDRSSGICSSCRQGRPESYAVQFTTQNQPAGVVGFAELASVRLPKGIDSVTVYSRAHGQGYAKVVHSFAIG
jgi:hypothetical protein